MARDDPLGGHGCAEGLAGPSSGRRASVLEHDGAVAGETGDGGGDGVAG